MGTEVTVILEEHGLYRVKELVRRLEEHFNRIEVKPKDFIIWCKCNKSLTKSDVQDYCCGLSDMIDNIIVHPCEDESFDDLGETYGFVTADKYRG